MHLSPSASVAQEWDSCLSEEIHSNGSRVWLLGMTIGTMGSTGRFGMVEVGDVDGNRDVGRRRSREQVG